MRSRTLQIVAALAALLGGVPAARAAEVSVSVSDRTVSVGVPFQLIIKIRNAEEEIAPVLPALPGLRVVGRHQPSRFERIHSFQGRAVRRVTVDHAFSLVAETPGQITIPSMTITVDGEQHATRPITITALSTDPGDLLYVEVVGERPRHYVGERVKLTLEIWLARFEDAETAVMPGAKEMWTTVDQRRWSVGVFDGQREVRFEERPRVGVDGVERTYYVYSIEAIVAPREAGPLDPGEIAIVVDYPLQRRPFRERTIVATVSSDPIRVEMPPAEGQPAIYRGAVGHFEIEAVARPTDVAVGDPITLTLTITDRSLNGVPLETLQPPPLEELAELTDGFRMPSDPLAGSVRGRRKTFTQTIRARDASVTEIPAIPFAFFDARRGRYATARTTPIPISVRPAATLALSDVVSAERNGGGARPTELTEVAGGLLPNSTGVEVLAMQPPFELGAWHAVAVAAPPLAFAVMAFGARRARRLRDDRGYARRRRAKRSAMRRLSAVRRGGADDAAQETLAAVTTYVADRCDLPAGAHTRAEVVGALRAAGLDDEVIAEVEGVLEECEQMRYAGGDGTSGNGITERAERCIQALERHRLA